MFQIYVMFQWNLRVKQNRQTVWRETKEKTKNPGGGRRKRISTDTIVEWGELAEKPWNRKVSIGWLLSLCFSTREFWPQNTTSNPSGWILFKVKNPKSPLGGLNVTVIAILFYLILFQLSYLLWLVLYNIFFLFFFKFIQMKSQMLVLSRTF